MDRNWKGIEDRFYLLRYRGGEYTVGQWRSCGMDLIGSDCPIGAGSDNAPSDWEVVRELRIPECEA